MAKDSKPTASSEQVTGRGAADEDVIANGARWTRIDFHLHTPGVSSFTCPAGINLDSAKDRADFAARYVDRLAAARIEIAAITDYNGVREEWFNAIRTAASSREITMLPGVELSLREGRGLHILAIFAADADVREIDECLRSYDKKPGRTLITAREHDEIDLSKHLHEALRALCQHFGCLLIPAHVSGDKGLIKELGAKAAAELINEVGVDALEHASSDAISKLTSSGVLSAERIASLACVEFSDPRGLDDVGGKMLVDGSVRGTWLKLSARDLSAIRLALHDPQTRLTTSSPPVAAHPRILRTRVSGSGFLGNLKIDWNDDLNALVGGRGSGKSAILESVRYAFDLPVYSEQEYRSESVRHAIGSGGVITVLVERPGDQAGKQYEIRRVFGEEPVVIDAGSGESLGVPPREVFGSDAEPIVLLQREIQEVSRDDAYRLKLLDVLVGEAAASAAAEVRATRAELRTNANKLVDAHRRAGKKAELDERARSIQREIDFFDSQGVKDKLERHTKIKKDDGRLNRARRTVDDEADGVWQTELSQLVDRLSGHRARLIEAASEQANELAGAIAALTTLIEGVEAAKTALTAAFGGAKTALDAAGERWAEVTAPLAQELRQLEEELGSKLERPERYLQLVQEKDDLGPQMQEVESAEADLKRLDGERARLLRSLADQRLKENRLRRETADEVNRRLAGKLQIDVTYKGQKAAWREKLASLLRGSGATADVVGRLAEPESTDGIQLAAAVAKGPKELAKIFDVTSAMAEKVCAWLTDNHDERLRALQLESPDDAVSVRLVVDGKPRSLERLSMGQRATAILLLLFALEGRLLILDQPEDDLDQSFVFEDVVGLLRAQKGLSEPLARRQVIAATHNPNIPVLGDAEQVLVLAAEDERAVVKTRASIDDSEVRVFLRAILEGGAEAFRRRAEKYGGLD